MARIQKTTNYKKFKYITENRGLYKKNLKNLKESIVKKNLTEYNPVLVNESMQVIDGQHRIEVCKELGLPVYYLKVKGTGMEDVIRLNTASKNWTLRDYIFSYIKQGNKNYEYLRDLQQNNHIPYTLGSQILTNNYNRQIVTDLVKQGKFEVKNGRLAWAEGFCLTLERFREHAPSGVKLQRSFTDAVATLYREQPGYITKILANLSKYSFPIKRLGTEKDYIAFFEEAYNFHKKNTKRFF